MRTNYYDIKYYYDELRNCKDRKLNFKSISTTYTKKIVLPDEVNFFNEGGEDNKKCVLLISQVRNDANKFLETHTVEDIDRDIDFFNLLDLVKHEEVIVKVDLKSAYWADALRTGVITEKTNQKYCEWYADVDPKFAKEDRLKALGSLATTKIIKHYENGKRIFEKDERIVEPTRNLYMAICENIDMLMKDVNYNVDGCKYYYWDCIFAQKEFAKDVIDYLQSRGYEAGVEEAKVKIVTIGDEEYLYSMYDKKSYMTKKENKLLLPIFDYEY